MILLPEKKKLFPSIKLMRKYLLKTLILILGISLITIFVNLLQFFINNQSKITFVSKIEVDARKSFTSNSGCNIPKLDPYEKSIKKYLLPPPTIRCSTEYPSTSLFVSDFNSSIRRITTKNSIYDTENCCFKGLNYGESRNYQFSNYESHYRITSNCMPINSNDDVTLIPNKFDSIILQCPKKRQGSLSRIDIFRFIREKPEIEERIQRGTESAIKRNVPRDFNVVILGLDAVSHMQFIRALPKSHNYLLNTLNAIELNGAAKNGDNTFPNLIPMLTGLDVKELKQKCWKNNSHFDECPFIWKEFRNNGYYTTYAEDGNHIGLFTLDKKGFKISPCNEHFRLMDNKIGNMHPNNSNLCYAAKLAFQVLLENLKNIANFMGATKRYFGFTWVNSLFHDVLERAHLGDALVFETLQWMQSQGHFNHTIFLLMSDHGIRTGPLRDTIHGSLEDRMPFRYFIFPDLFKQRYPLAIKTLQDNVDRLTTHFDLHETLKDFLDLRRITDENLMKRGESELTQRGISLFLPIPPNRNCQSSGIPDEWCFCDTKILIPVYDDSVKKGVELLVGGMNEIIRNNNSSSKCAILSLKEIVSVQKVYHNYQSDLIKEKQNTLMQLPQKYQVALKTKPGTGFFDMAITLENGNWKSGEIVRTSQYSQESKCLSDSQNETLKKICLCKSNL